MSFSGKRIGRRIQFRSLSRKKKGCVGVGHFVLLRLPPAPGADDLLSFATWGFATLHPRLYAVACSAGSPTGVLVNDPALHHEHDAPHGRDVFQRIAVERNDVGLQARRD